MDLIQLSQDNIQLRIFFTTVMRFRIYLIGKEVFDHLSLY